MKRIWVVACALGFVGACLQKKSDSDANKFWGGVSEIRGPSLGLLEKEIALTLDDGPSQYTLGLARFLASKNVPATFFMNYTNGPNGISQPFGVATLQGICSLRIHRIGNHTDFHKLGTQATVGRTWENIKRTHEAIKEHCPGSFYYFRSPGGNWNGEEEAMNKNAQMDREGIPLGEQYIGPVYWDFGGQAPVADWYSNPKDGCQQFVDKCRDNYIAEVVRKARGGVMLAHDVHATTMELLMGKNWKALLADPNASDAADGLVVRLQKMGYKFVSLSKNKEATQRLLRYQPVPANQPQ